jgi:hypothetical protein
MRISKEMFVAVISAIFSTLLLVPRAHANDTPITQAGHVDQLVGGWSLVSRVTTTSDGKVLSDPGLSTTPKGVLIYDRLGHVAAQLSRPGRTVEMLGDECREAEHVKGTNYTVNAKEHVVTHHLESALFPGDIGKDIKREFEIAGDTLTIRFHTTLRDGTPVVRTLVWARMK